MPKVIVLNGPSSVGKSSTAREVQRQSRTPRLNLALDHFIEMLPPRLIGTEDGMSFVRRHDDQHRPVTEVTKGPGMRRVHSGMRRAIAALAEAGTDVVVDDLFWDGEDRDYRQLLGDDVRLVGLFAPVELIEQREKQRGDRMLGLGRWCSGQMHRDVTYDLMLDTSALTPAEAARAICEAFNA